MAKGDRSANPRMSATEGTDVATCEAHGEPTRLSCVDCGKPICPKCAIRTEVGLKCEADAKPAELNKQAQALLKPSRARLVALIAGAALLVGAIVFAVVATSSDDTTPTEELPPVGTWEAAPALSAIRGTATATVLDDGTVVVAGGGVGQIPVPATELFSAADPQWQPSGDLNVARRGHSAALLDDGRILVSGGIAEGELLPSAEIYDPGSGEWSLVAPMAQARLGHTLTALGNGRVLATGGTAVDAAGGTAAGQTVRPTEAAEVFDPATGTWTATSEPMSSARFEHTATLLGDGRVLLVGGQGAAVEGISGPLQTTELYDPAIDAFVRSTDLSEPRANHTATLLDNGGVLITGGTGGPAGDRSLATAELFDAGAARWDQVAPMTNARTGHTATLLADGRVLVAAGETIGRSRRSIDSSEVFNPDEQSWRSGGTLPCPRSEQAAALLSDGSVIVVAGDASFPGQAPNAQGCVDRYRP